MLKKVVIIFFGIILLLTSCESSKYYSKLEISEYEFNNFDEIIVKSINGDIKIESWDNNKILVEAEKIADSEKNLDRIKVKTEKNKEVFKIYSEINKGISNARINYRIKVPYNFKGLICTTTNGDIEVKNIEAFIKLRTVNGDIYTKDISKLEEVSSVNGDIEIKANKIEENLNISTVNGDIELKILELYSDIDFSVNNGSIKISGHNLEYSVNKKNKVEGVIGKGKTKIVANTVNGSIELKN